MVREDKIDIRALNFVEKQNYARKMTRTSRMSMAGNNITSRTSAFADPADVSRASLNSSLLLQPSNRASAFSVLPRRSKKKIRAPPAISEESFLTEVSEDEEDDENQ